MALTINPPDMTNLSFFSVCILWLTLFSCTGKEQEQDCPFDRIEWMEKTENKNQSDDTKLGLQIDGQAEIANEKLANIGDVSVAVKVLTDYQFNIENSIEGRYKVSQSFFESYKKRAQGLCDIYILLVDNKLVLSDKVKEDLSKLLVNKVIGHPPEPPLIPDTSLQRVVSSEGKVSMPSGRLYSFKKMADNRVWLTQNLRERGDSSNCQDNCDVYGHLYTWDEAKEACLTLPGPGSWQLPTDDEWKKLLEKYGGYNDIVQGEIKGKPKTSFVRLSIGGDSDFNAVLAGSTYEGTFRGKDVDGTYWSATDQSESNAYNFDFNKNTKHTYRRNYLKRARRSVRCIKNL